MGQIKIEAVFENGIFRPLEPVNLSNHQQVTLIVPEANQAAPGNVSARELTSREGTSRLEDVEEKVEEVEYKPIPFRECQTIRVKVRDMGEMAPVPYPLDEETLNAENELEQR